MTHIAFRRKRDRRYYAREDCRFDPTNIIVTCMTKIAFRRKKESR